ncbi:MAG: ComF family protein [Kiritimatiellae bacterium]|jgi:ComF family protein|nr:ComF family protein [Kiritimatiellia bacterium]NLD90643.1 ComF family protein [Lentisphaerota bacterium]HOU21337.1 ComF family protein [Kiritimatiellia bacterium]HPC19376.1 ComF family protein [Kiritimatiellia bacterium]HQQ61803.1 ComF family protein [Kiritimatiellia bacterium]
MKKRLRFCPSRRRSSASWRLPSLADNRRQSRLDNRSAPAHNIAMKWALLDMFFSRTCEGCGIAMTEEPGALCWDCRAGVKTVQVPFCERCGDPIAGEVSGPFECAGCRALQPGFDWARSAVRYDGVAKDCLRRLKYNAGVWLLDDLVDWLVALWRTCPQDVRSADYVSAVPLYPKRQRDRGFNQSALLGARLSRRIGIPFRGWLLRRHKPTVTQTHLTATQRVHNVHGVFSVPWPRAVHGARILLVDDVMTTGATVSACARTLKNAGAASVMALTVARG